MSRTPLPVAPMAFFDAAAYQGILLKLYSHGLSEAEHNVMTRVRFNIGMRRAKEQNPRRARQWVLEAWTFVSYGVPGLLPARARDFVRARIFRPVFDWLCDPVAKDIHRTAPRLAWEQFRCKGCGATCEPELGEVRQFGCSHFHLVCRPCASAATVRGDASPTATASLEALH